jgi:hypothetical protein
MDENTPAQGTPADNQAAPDPIAALKGEQARKFDALNAKIAEMAALNNVIIEKLNTVAPKPAAKAESTENLADLMYSDPEKYAQLIEERAEKRVLSRIDEVNAKQSKHQAAMAELFEEFPELKDSSSPLVQKANEIWSKLPAEDRNSSTAFRLAAKEAALELNVKPKSKRTDEEFVGGGSASPTSARRNTKQAELDPLTKQFAEVCGLEVDAETEKRLIERSKRNFQKYQVPLSSKRRGK